MAPRTPMRRGWPRHTTTSTVAPADISASPILVSTVAVLTADWTGPSSRSSSVIVPGSVGSIRSANRLPSGRGVSSRTRLLPNRFAVVSWPATATRIAVTTTSSSARSGSAAMKLSRSSDGCACGPRPTAGTRPSAPPTRRSWLVSSESASAPSIRMITGDSSANSSVVSASRSSHSATTPTGNGNAMRDMKSNSTCDAGSSTTAAAIASTPVVSPVTNVRVNTSRTDPRRR